MLLPFYQCSKCNKVTESSLTWAGIHIKQSCGGCGAYIKFISETDCPTVAEYRQEIWQASDFDKTLIEKAKKFYGFKEVKDNKFRILQYNKLLLGVIELVKQKELDCEGTSNNIELDF